MVFPPWYKKYEGIIKVIKNWILMSILLTFLSPSCCLTYCWVVTTFPAVNSFINCNNEMILSFSASAMCVGVGGKRNQALAWSWSAILVKTVPFNTKTGGTGPRVGLVDRVIRAWWETRANINYQYHSGHSYTTWPGSDIIFYWKYSSNYLECDNVLH